MRGLVLVLLTWLLPGLVAAAEEAPRPPWLEDDVVQAAVEIGMNEAQLPEFRSSVTTFLEELRAEVEKLVRRGVPDLENAVRRERNKLARQMDERMTGILSAEQMPRYEAYRDLLLSKLKR